MMQKIKFAWLPLPAHRLHICPSNVHPDVKAFMNGWHSDGWVWLEEYRLVVNVYGERHRERRRTNDD